MSRSQVVFGVSPARAHAYLVDPRNRPRWQSSLRDVVDVEPGSRGVTSVGTSWTDVTLPGLRPRMELTATRPPSAPDHVGAWTEIGHWHGVRAELTLSFAPAPGAGAPDPSSCVVDVDFTIALSARAWGVAAGRLLSRVARPMVVGDLRRAARLLRTALREA